MCRSFRGRHAMTDRLDTLLAMLDAEPDDPFCLYAIGHEYANRGDDQAAIDYLDRTIEVDPSELYAFFHKARCQQRVGDVPGAAETLRQGLEHARAASDAKAVDEMQALLLEMEA